MKQVILFGAPGAGKGTQADMIQNTFGYKKISTGDLIRSEVKRMTPLGNAFKEKIDQGEFVPDGIIFEMLKERLSQGDISNGYILDGFPRTLEQAEILSSLGSTDEVALYLKVGDENVVVKRILSRLTCSECGAIFSSNQIPPQRQTCEKCGGKAEPRTDDTEVVVRKRVDVYRSETKPAIEFYRQKGDLVEVDAKKNIKDVFASIKGVLS